MLAITGIYDVPANAASSTKSVSLDQVLDKLDTWLTQHNLRIALALLASVLGICATAAR